MTCPLCRRPVEIDPLLGKPAGAKGYCLGTDTCIQEPPEPDRHLALTPQARQPEYVEIHESHGELAAQELER